MAIKTALTSMVFVLSSIKSPMKKVRHSQEQYPEKSDNYSGKSCQGGKNAPGGTEPVCRRESPGGQGKADDYQGEVF
jgi:hypothetical protein